MLIMMQRHKMICWAWCRGTKVKV